MVHQYIGTEPSGRNFNELILDYNSKYYSETIFTYLIKYIFDDSTSRKLFVPSLNINQKQEQLPDSRTNVDFLLQ